MEMDTLTTQILKIDRPVVYKFFGQFRVSQTRNFDPGNYIFCPKNLYTKLIGWSSIVSSMLRIRWWKCWAESLKTQRTDI